MGVLYLRGESVFDWKGDEIMAFVKIPNEIFSYKKIKDQHTNKTIIVRKYPLKATDLQVYVYLLSCCANRGSVKIKYRTIARQIGMKDVKGIQKAVNTLLQLNLITVKSTMYCGMNSCYQYSVTPISGNYFKLDRHILKMKLEKSMFAVYLCLLMHLDTNSEAFPSTSDIKYETGLAKATLRRAIKDLQMSLLITKTCRLNDCGDYTKNLFYVFDLKKREAILSRIRKIKHSAKMFISNLFIKISNTYVTYVKETKFNSIKNAFYFLI